MEYSLLKEINKKSLQGYLNARIYSEMYWPTFFPLKSTPFLSFESLTAEEGSRIAADVVAYNSSAPEKTRKIVSQLKGEIPAIRIKRSMKETDINTYNVLRAQASPDQQAILNLIFGDVDAVVDGVNARLEWMALKALSYGSITLDATNNAGVVTENVINYQVPTANKIGVGTVWTDVTNADPIADFNTIIGLADALGTKIERVLMNKATFARLRATAKIKDYVAVLVGYNTGRVKLTPGLEMINQALIADGKFPISIIDASIGIETADHAISYANPWTDHYITFIPTTQCGNTLHGPIAEETHPPKQVVQAKRGCVLVSKYSDVDPVKEYTKGEANACPVWNTVDRCFIQKTDATTWS